MNPDGTSRSRFEVSRENAAMWLVGVGFAFALIGFGAYGLMTGSTILFGRRTSIVVTGPAATGLSIAYMMLGLTLNIRFVWSKIPRWEELAEKLSAIPLTLFVIALVYAIYKIY